jgi:hypothetical protein
MGKRYDEINTRDAASYGAHIVGWVSIEDACLSGLVKYSRAKETELQAKR